jgi:hypothetical protein
VSFAVSAGTGNSRPQLEVPALALHPDGDVTDAALAVEPAVKELWLGLAWWELSEAECGAEPTGRLARGPLHLETLQVRLPHSSIQGDEPIGHPREVS